MHILLLGENLRKLQFLQDGLRYENVFPDILLLPQKREVLESKIIQANGLIVFFENFILEEYIHFYSKIKLKLSIIVLSENFSPLLMELQQKNKIKNFFIRPFPFRLIASEMRSYIFQEQEKLDNHILCIRNLQLNRETREVKIYNHSIYLRNKEFALLEFLMLHEGKVLSRETILEQVWDRNANIMTNTIDVHINKLRKKIELDDKFIRTIPCAGYLMG